MFHNRVMALIAETLQKWMKDRGLSTHALARLSNVPQTTVHRIVSGDALEPRRTTLERIARSFGRSANDLYAESSLETPSQSLNKRSQELAAVLETLNDDQLAAILEVARQLQKSA